MEAFLTNLLMQSALNLNVQALANHQTTQHFADLGWLDKLTSMDIAEYQPSSFRSLFDSQIDQYPKDQPGKIRNTSSSLQNFQNFHMPLFHYISYI